VRRRTFSLRANAQIVIVDVTVDDGNGNPVHGLKQSDFTVLEDNAQQHIDHYEELRTPPEGEHVPPVPPMGPVVYTNFSLVPDNGPLDILVLDMLNTPAQNQMDARQRVLDFLKSMKPNRHVAIFGLSSRLFLLQGFTSDPELLKAALKHKNASAQASALLPEPGTGLADQMQDSFGDRTDMAAVMANVQQFEAEVTAEQTRTRILATLSAFNQLGRYLSALPGRKNVLWISGSFPLNHPAGWIAEQPIWWHAEHAGGLPGNHGSAHAWAGCGLSH
jgi:VWFA-related protein